MENIAGLCISASGLNIGYRLPGGRIKSVHEGMDFEVSPGGLTCLLGLNGAGKSTLIKTMCGIIPPLAGEVLIGGRPVKDYSHRELSMVLGTVFTGGTNVGGMSVYDLVSLGRHPFTDFFGRLGLRDRQAVADAMEAVGITAKAGSYVSDLSDGERQKAMIAKLLAQECPVMVLDEPTAFLDALSRIETMRLLRKTAVESGKTVLLSTHDLDNAISFADTLIIIAKGRALACGAPEDLILSGAVADYFNRDGITFDSTTGKMGYSVSAGEVGISGEPSVTRWVSNALMRNGLTPVAPREGMIRVECRSGNDIDIVLRDGSRVNCSLIGTVARSMRSLFPEEARDGKSLRGLQG